MPVSCDQTCVNTLIRVRLPIMLDVNSSNQLASACLYSSLMVAFTSSSSLRTDGALTLPPPWRWPRTIWASSSRPFFRSHRGDSGSKADAKIDGRPTASMVRLTEAQIRTDPTILYLISVWTKGCTISPRATYQKPEPSMMALFRSHRSDNQPETTAPTNEPPGIAAVMPPWVVEIGPRQRPCSSKPR